MPAIDELYIEVKADLNSIKKELKDLKTESGKAGREMGSALDKSARWGILASGIQSVVMSVRDFANQMKQVLGQSVKNAAELTVLRSHFKGTAKDIELLRKATSSVVSEASLIKLSNQAMALGLSLEQTALFFDIADDAADKYGGTIEQNMERLIKATQGGSKGLVALGISAKAYEQKVKELVEQQGKTITSINAEELARIKLIALIESSGTSIDKINKKIKDEADLIDSWSVELDEAKTRMGALILKGIQPLLESLDKGDGSGKRFLATIVSIGGVALQLLPILAQLYNVKRLFASGAAIATVAVTAETAALTANAAASTAAAGSAQLFGNINKMFAVGSVLAYAGAIGAVIALTYELTRSINEQAKAAKASREEMERLHPEKFNVGFGDPFDPNRGKKVSAPGTVNLGGFKSRIILPDIKEENRKTAVSVQDIKDQIESLTEANNSANITWAKYYDNLKKIEALQSRLQLKSAQEGFVGYKSIEDFVASNEGIGTGTSKAIQKRGMSREERELQEKGDFELLYDDKDLQNIDDEIQGSMDALIEKREKEIDTVERSKATMEMYGDTVASALARGIMSGENLGVVFKNLMLQLGEMILKATIFKTIMTALGIGSGGGGFFASLFAARGGIFENGRQVAAFASGGSFIVPKGYDNDRFPMLVSSGERVQVTPTNRVGESEKLLAEVVSSVRGLNSNIAQLTPQVNFRIETDIVKVVRDQILPILDSFTRANRKAE